MKLFKFIIKNIFKENNLDFFFYFSRMLHNKKSAFIRTARQIL